MNRNAGGPGGQPGPAFAAALASITLVGPLSIHMFLPVMPAVQSDFRISSALVGLTFSVTLLVIAIATLVYGALSDRHGRRPLLLGGLALFLVGSALSAIADSVTGLVAGRLVQAAGAGCGVALARAMARDAYGAERLVQVIAYLTMAYTLGPMLAPLAGGFLADRFGWRSIFVFALVAGVCIACCALLWIRETLPAAARRQARPGLARSFGRLLAVPRFDAFVLQTGFSTGTFMSMATASSFLMRDLLGRSASEYGLFFLCFPSGFFLGNLISSRLSGRFSVESMVLAGSLITLVAVLVQSVLILGGRLSPAVIFAPGLIVTLCQGISMPNAQAGALRVVPELAGTAAGIGVFSQMVVGAIFAQGYSLIADGTPGPMVLAASIGAVLTLAVGVIPILPRYRFPRA